MEVYKQPTSDGYVQPFRFTEVGGRVRQKFKQIQTFCSKIREQESENAQEETKIQADSDFL